MEPVEPAEAQVRTALGKYAYLLVALIVVLIGLSAAWVILQWSIAESVYSAKAGLDWFGINFYHDNLFIAAALFSLLLVNPRVGRSDLFPFLSTFGNVQRRETVEGDRFLSEARRTETTKMNIWLWALWQTAKWAAGFYAFVTLHGVPFLGEIMNSLTMMSMGLGSWANVPTVFLLPAFPASGSQLIQLMATMQIQYNVLQYVITAVLFIFALRMLLRLLTNLTTRRSDVWLRNLLAVAAAASFAVILGAPYWVMNIATPYLYGGVWTVFLLTIVGMAYVSTRRNLASTRFNIPKAVAIVLVVLLVVQAGAGAFFFLNWNNNYLNYQWYPQTQKQITVTQWSAGLDNIQVNNITSLPTSNPDTTLNLVRQWDQGAASVTNTKEIGAYNWMGLASSEIVFYNNTEYWVSPTTPVFPATDWISEHIIYTHAAKVLVINTHNGSVIPVTSAYGVPNEPLIYYGQGAGFTQNVYVHVPGYDEIQNVTYPGTPDYVLSGWQKTMWMTLAEGQVGFAFSGQAMNMLWNRNVFNRVGSILIPGLTMDPASYLVSDGTNLYYAIQVYINYPLQSGFAVSPYLRYFGVVLVNIQDGSMQGYNVSNLIGSNTGSNSSDFLTTYYHNYYSSWGAPPSWLVPQLRYPEQLLGSVSVPGQLDYDFIYHVTDPFVFRSATQFYERPTTNTTVQYIPFAVGNKTYFVAQQLVQYAGSVSQNLAGMYVAYGGDRLGQIQLYVNPSTSTPIIGPAAAENALNTNQQVRTQLTLLPNYRIGSYLMYSVGGALTYFVAVYTNPGTSGVVTQLPFMTAINPSTAAVGVGTSAQVAFDNLGGNATRQAAQNNVTAVNRGTLVKAIATAITAQGYSLLNVTSLNPTIVDHIATVSLSASGLNQTVSHITGLLSTYGSGSVGNTVYVWNDSSGNLNYGILKTVSPGVTEEFYVTITS